MSEFSASFFELAFKQRLLIIDFCVISYEVSISVVGYSYFNIIVLCAIIVSIIRCFLLSPSPSVLFSLSEKAILDFNISTF